MSIQSEIERISQAKTDIHSAIESKGVTVPDDTLISEMAPYIQQIREAGTVVTSVSNIGPDENGNAQLKNLRIYCGEQDITYNGGVEQALTISPATVGAATTAQGAKADTAVQSVNGKDPDGDGNVQLTAADVGAATASHSHAASDISSGTLPVSRGGTGASTASAARSQLGASPIYHASSGTSYGKGSSSMYGHVKLSDTASASNGVSSGVAATPKCVADAVAGVQIGYDIYTGVIDNLYVAINGQTTSASYEVLLNRDATGNLTDYSVLLTVEGQNAYDALGVTACVQNKSGGGFYIMLYNNSDNRATVKAISWLVLIPHRT